MAFTPFETSTTNISTLSDRPNQNDGLSSAQLKGRFDKAGNDIKTYINDVLLEELESVTDGDSGADNIGATAVGDGTATTVQGILEEIDADVTALDGTAVHKTGNETIDDVKTFSSSPIVPAPTTDTQASTKKYVDDTDGARKTYVDNLDALAVHLAGTETITGVKTFSASPIVPAPTTDTQASTKKYVDDADVLKVNITDIVNDLTTGGTNVPLSAEQGKTLQGEVGTLASLSTTEKGSLVGAINEVDGHADTNATSIGTLASLTTTEKTNLVGAINELDTDVGTNATAIGTLTSLTTTEKTNLVGAINEVDADVGTNATAIGTLASLTTTEKTNLVGAINELDTDKVETSAITNTLTETTEGKVLDARQGKALSDKIGNQTYTEDNYVTDSESVTASLDALDMGLKDTADSISTHTGATNPHGITKTTVGLDNVDNVKQATTTTYTTTLDTTWSGTEAPYTKEQTVTGILSTDDPIVDIVLSGTYATDSKIEADWAEIYRIVTSANSVTLYAHKKPTNSIPLQFKVVR
jgi:hypothetical protein